RSRQAPPAAGNTVSRERPRTTPTRPSSTRAARSRPTNPAGMVGKGRGGRSAASPLFLLSRVSLNRSLPCLRVRDREALGAAGRARRVVVAIAGVAALPTPGAFVRYVDRDVVRRVRRVAIDVDGLGIGRHTRAEGIARCEQAEGDRAAGV